MAEKTTTSNSLIQKFPKKLAAFFTLIFIAPIVASYFILIMCHVFEFNEMVKTIFSPFSIISAVLFAVYLVLLYRFLKDKLFVCGKILKQKAKQMCLLLGNKIKSIFAFKIKRKSKSDVEIKTE